MAFDNFGYSWHGAFTDPGLLEARSGVYCIWDRVGEQWSVLDVGESADVRARLLSHDRHYQWILLCRGTLYFAATYTPGLQQFGRRQIEQGLRAQLLPPCGVR